MPSPCEIDADCDLTEKILQAQVYGTMKVLFLDVQAGSDELPGLPVEARSQATGQVCTSVQIAPISRARFLRTPDILLDTFYRN